jgi:hypothetical protein
MWDGARSVVSLETSSSPFNFPLASLAYVGNHRVILKGIHLYVIAQVYSGTPNMNDI